MKAPLIRTHAGRWPFTVSEMRIDYGPGYRVYFVQRGEALVILLCGGDKRDQSRDIARALELAKEV